MNGSELAGGLMMAIIGGIALLVMIYWVILPFILVSKFNKLIMQAHETNRALAVISHQINALDRNQPPVQQ